MLQNRNVIRWLKCMLHQGFRCENSLLFKKPVSYLHIKAWKICKSIIRSLTTNRRSETRLMNAAAWCSTHLTALNRTMFPVCSFRGKKKKSSFEAGSLSRDDIFTFPGCTSSSWVTAVNVVTRILLKVCISLSAEVMDEQERRRRRKERGGRQ